MKAFYLVFAVFLVGIASIQAANNFRTTDQPSSLRLPNAPGHLLSPRSFKALLEKVSKKKEIDENATPGTNVVVLLFQYYLDDVTFSNIVHLVFGDVDVDRNGRINRAEFDTLLQGQGISAEDTQRLWSLSQTDQRGNTLKYTDFTKIAELIFDEMLAIITFTYFTRSADHSPYDGVTLPDLQEGLTSIFTQLVGGYPLPRNEDVAYLFSQCDLDGDNKVNIEEFYYLESIFLRYYRAGIENNAFAHLVLTDNLFELLWRKEALQAAHQARLIQFKESFNRFFQMAVIEKILTQVSHMAFSKVDLDHDGVITGTEFYQIMSTFGVSQNETILLYNLANTDPAGDVDFGEFTSIFETFVHRAVAKFGMYYIQELGGQMDISATYTLFYYGVQLIGINPIPDATYRTLFATADNSGTGVLDMDSFGKLSSAIISYFKSRARDEMSKKREETTALPISADAIYEAIKNKTQEQTVIASNLTFVNEILSKVEEGDITANVTALDEILAPPVNDDEIGTGSSIPNDLASRVGINVTAAENPPEERVCHYTDDHTDAEEDD